MFALAIRGCGISGGGSVSRGGARKGVKLPWILTFLYNVELVKLGNIELETSKVAMISNLRTICEFPDVFCEALSGLPPDQEVEFIIKMFFGKVPVSISSYRMALTELKELKV
ncbi:Gag protease polyprotein [Gossypium australe]|uniref:Gag protease polyprotein n=1 Tax=Gossypium australe TaxID=47621 RepID=A0A5B6W9M9_9ROSI|nr:Gag protease polyprotein [Gossypium australe]